MLLPWLVQCPLQLRDLSLHGVFPALVLTGSLFALKSLIFWDR